LEVVYWKNILNLRLGMIAPGTNLENWRAFIVCRGK
jgi:hypothetical protein